MSILVKAMPDGRLVVKAHTSMTHVVGARMVGGAQAIPFSYVEVGAQFRFPKSNEVHTKLSAGRYRDAQGRKFSTGRHVAVIRHGVPGVAKAGPPRSPSGRLVAKALKHKGGFLTLHADYGKYKITHTPSGYGVYFQHRDGGGYHLGKPFRTKDAAMAEIHAFHERQWKCTRHMERGCQQCGVPPLAKAGPSGCDKHDHCASSERRLLPTGGGAHAILCRRGHAEEVAYRRHRNRAVSGIQKHDLPAWKSLKIYED